VETIRDFLGTSFVVWREIFSVPVFEKAASLLGLGRDTSFGVLTFVAVPVVEGVPCTRWKNDDMEEMRRLWAGE
jgi:hypothetical protein